MHLFLPYSTQWTSTHFFQAPTLASPTWRYFPVLQPSKHHWSFLPLCYHCTKYILFITVTSNDWCTRLSLLLLKDSNLVFPISVICSSPAQCQALEHVQKLIIAGKSEWEDLTWFREVYKYLLQGWHGDRKFMVPEELGGATSNATERHYLSSEAERTSLTARLVWRYGLP